MRRERRLSRRERKEAGREPAVVPGFVECVVCRRPLTPGEFVSEPPTAVAVLCDHGSRFPACAACEVAARHSVAEHDRDGSPVGARPAARASAGEG